MVGKEKPLSKVNRSDSLMVDTSSVIVKQELSLLSPQSTSSEHSSFDQPPSAQSFTSICEDKAIIKYEDDSNNENTSSNDKPDRWVLTFIHSIVFSKRKMRLLAELLASSARTSSTLSQRNIQKQFQFVGETWFFDPKKKLHLWRKTGIELSVFQTA